MLYYILLYILFQPLHSLFFSLKTEIKYFKSTKNQCFQARCHVTLYKRLPQKEKKRFINENVSFKNCALLIDLLWSKNNTPHTEFLLFWQSTSFHDNATETKC